MLQTGDHVRILDAWLQNDSLVVLSHDFRRLAVPLSELNQRVGNARKVRAFEIDGDGSFLYWPAADAHLGWEQLERLVNPEAALKAQQALREFNVRYGAAIRALRTDAGLRQGDIQGLTERQVRRIEGGETKLSSPALRCFARSHGMSPRDYLAAVARRL